MLLCDVSQQWILDPDDLMRVRHEDLAVLSQDEYQKIIIFFANCKWFYVVSTEETSDIVKQCMQVLLKFIHTSCKVWIVKQLVFKTK